MPTCSHKRKTMPPQTFYQHKKPVVRWIVRLCFTLVFALNITCALSFILQPSLYTSSYELSGVSGQVALQGLGIAFLMWNATYLGPIIDPHRFYSLCIVVLTQQVIGIIGELIIVLSLPPGHLLLTQSLLRFILFDTGGLVVMALPFALYCHQLRCLRPIHVPTKKEPL